jgi:signal transduction histidine kinase
MTISCNKDKPVENADMNPYINEEPVKPYDFEAEKAGELSKEKSARTKALIQFAFKYMEKNGVEKTLDAIDNPKNRDHKKFIDGDYYIWVFQTDFKRKATVVAHAVNSTLKGKEWYDVKDPDGKQFFHDIVRISKHKGEGWVLYRWAHPVSKKALPKVTYFRKSGDLVFNNGYYLE